MPHWTGQHRGTRPLPNYPQPPTTNDLSSRVSRLEVHQWHTHADLDRIESESLRRGLDLAAEVRGISVKMEALESHIGTARTLAKWLPSALRYLAAIILFALLIAGKLSIAEIKTLLPVVGLPTG